MSGGIDPVEPLLWLIVVLCFASFVTGLIHNAITYANEERDRHRRLAEHHRKYRRDRYIP